MDKTVSKLRCDHFAEKILSNLISSYFGPTDFNVQKFKRKI